MRAFVIFLVVTLIAACASTPDRKIVKPRGPNIAEVLADLPALDMQPVPAAKPTREDVMAAYSRVHGRLVEPEANHAIGKRLADLEMAVGEDLDIEGVSQPYDRAIERYETLLDGPAGVPLDQILYQLARAYDISARSGDSLHMLNRLIDEYPDSAYVPEARFRRAEVHFSAGRFQDAAQDYQFVVALENETPYFKNARYMLGWSEFKQSNLEEGLTAFFAVIGDVLQADEQPLPQTEQQLLDDSFRAVVLALEYLDGPETLAERMRELERPNWQLLAYDKLASDYHEKERYLDSVKTWLTFVEDNALDQKAPMAQERIVKTLLEADFPSEALARKEEFVERFGVYSEFYETHDAAVKAEYTETLHTYLTDLAQHAHGEAQALAEEDKASKEAYLTAAKWYEEFVQTYPEDDAVAEKLFLLGEVYTEADEPMRAVAAYQQVVRQHLDFAKANEAGYAAILGLEKALEQAPESEVEIIQHLEVDAQIEFALLFGDDPRAPAVQAAAAQSLFEMERFDEAVDVAENLLTVFADAEPDIIRSSLLVVGHGRFELADFAAAEQAYHTLLASSLEDSQRLAVEERLLAAVYKQGELAEQEQDVDGAVHHYMRIAALDATAELAVKGHFDAIAVVETSGDSVRAAALLESLRERYPQHELVADAGLRLANIYEESGEWSLAARELSLLAETESDAEMRRQSRYHAAELYLKVEDASSAIAQFEQYVSNHPEPAELRFEAMHQLDTLFESQGDGAAMRVWKKEKIALHEKLGDEATDRMTHVAAHDSYFLAEDRLREFEALRLTHPLAKSLKKKQRALKASVAAFEQVAQYQVLELATAATYHIADLYRHLGDAIMDSDRPENLSELELAQYEILLEEQAYPFEEQAISLHEINMRRSWEGVYDDWVKRSFDALRQLMPSRFNKQEMEIAYVEAIY